MRKGARTFIEAGADGTRPERSSMRSFTVPADGTSAAIVGNGDFGASPLFLGSSRTSNCLPVFHYVGCRT